MEVFGKLSRSVYDVHSPIPTLIVGTRVRLPSAVLALATGAVLASLFADQLGTSVTIALAALPLVAPVAIAKSATACGMNALASFARYNMPLGIRAVDATAFVAVSAITAGLLGTLLSTIGGVLDLIRWLPIIAAICLYLGLRDLGFMGDPRVPSSRWQVPAEWVERPHRAAVVWGFFLGTGVATQMPYPSFYALLLVCAALPLPLAAGVMGIYGLTRALPAVGSSLSPQWSGTPDITAVLRFRLLGHATSGLGCVALAGTLIVLAFTRS